MATKLNKLTPNLMVEDVNQTVAFYKEVLGFEPLATMPESGQFEWAMMKSGNVEIMFQSRASLTGELPVLTNRPVGASQTLYIEVEDVKGLYASLQNKAKVVQEMHRTFYGADVFAIEDCNGYILAFAENIQS